MSALESDLKEDAVSGEISVPVDPLTKFSELFGYFELRMLRIGDDILIDLLKGWLEQALDLEKHPKNFNFFQRNLESANLDQRIVIFLSRNADYFLNHKNFVKTVGIHAISELTSYCIQMGFVSTVLFLHGCSSERALIYVSAAHLNLSWTEILIQENCYLALNHYLQAVVFSWPKAQLHFKITPILMTQWMRKLASIQEQVDQGRLDVNGLLTDRFLRPDAETESVVPAYRIVRYGLLVTFVLAMQTQDDFFENFEQGVGHQGLFKVFLTLLEPFPLQTSGESADPAACSAQAQAAAVFYQTIFNQSNTESARDFKWHSLLLTYLFLSPNSSLDQLRGPLSKGDQIRCQIAEKFFELITPAFLEKSVETSPLAFFRIRENLMRAPVLKSLCSSLQKLPLVKTFSQMMVLKIKLFDMAMQYAVEISQPPNMQEKKFLIWIKLFQENSENIFQNPVVQRKILLPMIAKILSTSCNRESFLKDFLKLATDIANRWILFRLVSIQLEAHEDRNFAHLTLLSLAFETCNAFKVNLQMRQWLLENFSFNYLKQHLCLVFLQIAIQDTLFLMPEPSVDFAQGSFLLFLLNGLLCQLTPHQRYLGFSAAPEVLKALGVENCSSLLDFFRKVWLSFKGIKKEELADLIAWE